MNKILNTKLVYGLNLYQLQTVKAECVREN